MKIIRPMSPLRQRTLEDMQIGCVPPFTHVVAQTFEGLAL